MCKIVPKFFDEKSMLLGYIVSKFSKERSDEVRLGVGIKYEPDMRDASGRWRKRKSY